METIFFTVVQPDGTEKRIYFTYKDIGGYERISAEAVTVELGGEVVVIEPQQLMELGSLFLALAGVEVDFSGADALLDGFSLKGKEAATKLAEALEE